MSSHRQILPCDAVLQRNDQPAGPMRLPTKNATAFIDEFNRKYYSAGLTLQSLKSLEPELPSAEDYDSPVNGPSPQ